VEGVASWEGEAGRKRRTWRVFCIAAVLVAASLVTGLMVFSWLSSMPDTGNPTTAASDERAGEHLDVRHSRMRF
jgi:anti-sigma factor RsiW